MIVATIMGTLALVFSVFFAPFAISEAKIKDGYRRLDILGIPEIYQKNWYRKDRLWVRTALIWSHYAAFGCMATLYLLVKLN